ncbi:TPA: restriction endonuclease subunit S [Staphylococcus aureus]|nr:restriction endonuclease subunit S [Staphylococcus aureus]HDF8419618.1 restriction endonuclease subunit S [Staphylococcus aureus]HDF9635774.1 restriction endonuclease subunit S [Staphylococcus aureus]HDF9643844.1 restriction endonuclease subunit S [Staphylococcus aureus]HDG0198800.1 restriction endonuclease subunit S [Staphylococcus aureus]
MSNTQKKNVPELRFPGFEGEWEEKKLGDLTDRVIRKNKNLESKKPLTISGQLGLIDQTEYFSKSVSSKNLENYTLIKNGEFAYNKSYSNGYPLGAIKRLTRYDSGVLSSLYICFSIKSEMSKDFMEAYFDSTHWYREVSGIAVEGARNHGLLNVSVNDFFTILIKYPSLEEQQKIGKFFSKLDRQIELEEQKLELLQQQKKGYMQKIFSQELRFKNENGNDYPDWERIKFFDVIDKVIDFRGRTPKKLNMEWSDEGYLALSAVNVKKGYIDFNVEAKYGNLDLYTRWMRGNELYKGQVLFTTEGPMGNVAQVPDNKGYILSQRTIAFNSNEKITDNFLASLLSSENVYNDLLKLCSGATAKGVSQKNLNRLYVTIPHSISEQEEIAEFFRKINQLVELQKYKIEHTKSQKQVFLQKMFI